MELLSNDPVLNLFGLSIVRGPWKFDVCSTCSVANKTNVILFWKGVQSSDSLAEEFKKQHQVFVFTGIWKVQMPHLCVPEITYVWGSMPTRPTSQFKSVLNQGISHVGHFYTQYTPLLLSAVFVWERGHVTFILPILKCFREECRVVRIFRLFVRMHTETEKMCSIGIILTL